MQGPFSRLPLLIQLFYGCSQSVFSIVTKTKVFKSFSSEILETTSADKWKKSFCPKQQKIIENNDCQIYTGWKLETDLYSQTKGGTARRILRSTKNCFTHTQGNLCPTNKGNKTNLIRLKLPLDLQKTELLSDLQRARTENSHQTYNSQHFKFKNHLYMY